MAGEPIVRHAKVDRVRRFRTVTALTLLAIVLPVTLAAANERTLHVARGGTDGEPGECTGGSAEEPWGSIQYGMQCLRPGDTLLVGGGTYRERVLPVVTPGRADAPITVTAAEGERVVVEGLIRLANADYWHLDRIDVTRDNSPYASGQYLVKFRDGVGWTLTNAEIWGARSYSALRIETSGTGTGPANWRVANNCIHDTASTNLPNRDHNVYIATNASSGGGVVEENLLFNAPNGTNIKLGYEPDDTRGSSNIVIRRNTMWNAVQNLLATGASANNLAEQNLVGAVIRPPGKSWYPHIRGIGLDGPGNIARDNLAAGPLSSLGVIVYNDWRSDPGWLGGGGNRTGSPRFDHTRGCDGFRPTDPEAAMFGHTGFDPSSYPQPPVIDTATACAATPSLPFRDVNPNSTHASAIGCAATNGIAQGTTADAFTPADLVTRGQVATFLARVIDLAAPEKLAAETPNAFVDDDGSTHESAINRLAAAGVIAGVTVDRYASSRPVTREQMAALLARTLTFVEGVAATGSDYFGDDDRSVHEEAINVAADIGVVGGVRRGWFHPGAKVRRDQMATFVVRCLAALSRP